MAMSQSLYRSGEGSSKSSRLPDNHPFHALLDPVECPSSFTFGAGAVLAAAESRAGKKKTHKTPKSSLTIWSFPSAGFPALMRNMVGRLMMNPRDQFLGILDPGRVDAVPCGRP